MPVKPIIEAFGKKGTAGNNGFRRRELQERSEEHPDCLQPKRRPSANDKIPVCGVRESRALPALKNPNARRNEERAHRESVPGIKLLSGERPRSRYLLPEEEDRLIEVLVGSLAYLRQIIVLYINTGVRANELLKLLVQAADFHRLIVHIDGEKGDEHREVPLNDTSNQIFRELITVARARAYTHIFTNPRTGKPYVHLYHGWRKASRLAGIENLRIHDLRHTFATRAADDGVPLTAIQAVMGHKSITTTMQYTHATDGGKRRAVQAAERKPGKVVNIWSKVAGGEK